MKSAVLVSVIRTQMNIALEKMPIFWILQHQQAEVESSLQTH